jgi:hypothetical protein
MFRGIAHVRAELCCSQAGGDLNPAAVQANPGRCNHSFFNAQQATEKALEAILSDRDQSCAVTHSGPAEENSAQMRCRYEGPISACPTTFLAANKTCRNL